MKQDTQNGMKRVSVNVDQMQAFVIINNDGMMINAGINAKIYLIKVLVIEDIFGILVTVNVNMTNSVMLVSIWIMKIVSVEKGQQIN